MIDEATGRNVAVAYDEKDAALLAAGPCLLARLVDVTARLQASCDAEERDPEESEAIRRAYAAISYATGGAE